MKRIIRDSVMTANNIDNNVVSVIVEQLQNVGGVTPSEVFGVRTRKYKDNTRIYAKYIFEKSEDRRNLDVLVNNGYDEETILTDKGKSVESFMKPLIDDIVDKYPELRITVKHELWGLYTSSVWDEVTLIVKERDASSDEDSQSIEGAIFDNSRMEFAPKTRPVDDEDLVLEAIMYNLGATLEEAREIYPTLSEDIIEEYIEYYNLKDLPLNKRVEVWNNRKKVQSATDSKILSFTCPVCQNKTVYSTEQDVHHVYEVDYHEHFICDECGTEFLSEPQYDGTIKFVQCTDEDQDDVTAANYGGAFDIDPEMYFTRDDIVDFGEYVCEHLNEIFNDTYDLADVNMIDPSHLSVAVIQNSDEAEFSTTVKIDMRKIKKPHDLKDKYSGNVVFDLRQQIEAYKNEVNASQEIHAGMYDDPPEYDDSDILPIEVDNETIQLDLDATIEVDDTGMWDYEDKEYTWARNPKSSDGSWDAYIDAGERVDLDDVVSIVEKVDELIIDKVPAQPGRYRITGEVELVYAISGIEKKITDVYDAPNESGTEVDYEIYTDNAEVEYLEGASSVTEFKFEKI